MRSFLITGGNRGIGLEMVKQLLAHPTSSPDILIATCRNPTNAKVLQDLKKNDKRLHILELDVTNFDSYPVFVSKVSEIVGENGLTVFLSNAGMMISRDGKLHEVVDAEMLLTQYKTNTIAPILLTKALLPLLKKSSTANNDKPLGINRAAVLLISSFLGSIGSNEGEKVGGFWGYRESKAALNIAARTMTEEFKGDKIGVLMLHPGWVATDMGGEKALVQPKDSVEGLIKIFLELNDKINGAFIKFDGGNLPW
uniref:Short-chain dehydrogenase n=1 Tax=Clastoptera arizonana TaxID=38151 RepID=A0A1B6DNX6_9HEMI